MRLIRRPALAIPPDLRPRIPRDHQLAAWIALLLVLAAGLLWGAHLPYSWDADNIAPGPVLRGLARRFGPGWSSSYGPVPYYLIAAVYVPLLALFKLSGELGTPVPEYPWGFDHPVLALGVLIVTARLVTLLVAVLAAWTLIRAAFPPESPARRRWIVPLLLIGSPVFVYYARTSNVDMHYFGWLALGFLLVERRASGPAAMAGAAAAAVAAVCSKEQSAPFAAVILGAALLRAGRWEGRRRAAGLAAIALAAPAAYAAAWMLPFNLAGWRAHHDFIFNVARYDRAYPLTPEGFAALGGRLLELLPVVFGWPVLAALALAVLLRPALRGLEARAVATALYLIGFVGPVGYVYPRFLLPVLLLAVPLAARGLDLAFERAARWPGMGAPIAAAVILLGLTGGPNLAAVQLTDPRHEVSRWLAALPPGVSVEIAGNPRFQAPAPPGRPVLHTTFDTLKASPRGPRGDVVLLSSLDEAYFRRDPAVKAAFWDSLAAGAAYRPPLWFRPPRNTGNIRNLFVSPTVQAYVRRGVPLTLERR